MDCEGEGKSKLVLELAQLRELVSELQACKMEDKKTLEALRKSELRHRSLYTKTPAMLHSINFSGQLLDVSDHWLEVLGYQRNEVIGKKSIDFLVEESRHQAETVDLPRFWRAGKAREVPYQFFKKNGEIVDVLLSAIAERDEKGKLVSSRAILVDVTECKRMERKLRESEQNFRDSFENACRRGGLSPRERDVSWLVLQGLQNKQIARSLDISENTVKNHMKKIFSRTGTHNRASLVNFLLTSSQH